MAKSSRKLSYEPRTRTKSEWDFIAQKLKEMAHELDCIEQFYHKLDIPKRTFYEAIERFPIMAEAHEYAKEVIGMRREKLCIDRNLGMGTVAARSLTHFLKRWKDDVEWHANLKLQEEDNKQKIVVIEKFKDE